VPGLEAPAAVLLDVHGRPPGDNILLVIDENESICIPSPLSFCFDVSCLFFPKRVAIHV
jgi:hypothetical protein